MMALRKQGYYLGRNRIMRLMRECGLKVRQKRAFKSTTNSKHTDKIAKNHLQQCFSVSKPNSVFAGDITYIETKEGTLYLSVVMDLFSRKICGFGISPRMTSGLVCEALIKCNNACKISHGALFHSDRGSQYTSKEYRDLLKHLNIKASMSDKGNCYDNSVVESFFGTLKVECVKNKQFDTKEEAYEKITKYIDVYYNKIRLHSSLKYCSPEQFEAKYLKHK